MNHRVPAFTSRTGIVALAAAVLTHVGCGGKPVVPVAPRVTLDGQPLAGASVSFFRTAGEEGRAAFGMTDNDGVARLTTFDPFDGAIPGSYDVVIVKAPENAMTFEAASEQEDPESLLKMSASRGAGAKSRRRRVRTVIPRLYGSARTTPLKCTVERGMPEPLFELSTK